MELIEPNKKDTVDDENNLFVTQLSEILQKEFKKQEKDVRTRVSVK